MPVLGRALARRPTVLLVDEMSLGLAPMNVTRLLAALQALTDDALAVLVVEQFAALALNHADVAHVLYGGHFTFTGVAQAVLNDPTLLRSAYVGATAAAPNDARGSGTRP